MKFVLTLIGGMVAVAAVLLLVAASLYNYGSDRRPESKEFMAGKAPQPHLDGPLNGQQFTGLGDNWAGKQFNAVENTGINNFKSKSGATTIEQRYPFTTSLRQGLRNKNQTVLHLNYNVAGNPFWLKPIRDEVVEVSPNHYLGKIQLKIGFVVVTLGYFRLSK